MKRRFTALAICVAVLLGCRLGSAPSEAAPTPETPSAAPTVPAEPPTAVPTAPAAPAGTPTALSRPQEALKAEWQDAISDAILLQTACVLMFETHSDFGEGEIDLDTARSELEMESNFVSFIWQGMARGPVPTDAVGPYLLDLEEEGRALIGHPIGADSIGSSEILGTLSETCGSVDRLMQEIVTAGLEAGLTEASLDEIDQGLSEIITDWYDLTIWGR
jgi:hypothetical protein